MFLVFEFNIRVTDKGQRLPCARWLDRTPALEEELVSTRPVRLIPLSLEPLLIEPILVVVFGVYKSFRFFLEAFDLPFAVVAPPLFFS